MAPAPRPLRIFLASPGDVFQEREIALEVLDRLPYDPLLVEKITIREIAWDKRGAGAPILAGITPQDSISRGLPQPADCDIVVVIFWSRMGTPLPPPYQKKDGSPYLSGTEWEYHNAVEAFREKDSPLVLLYRRIGVTFDADAPDLAEGQSQYEKVKNLFADPSIGGYTPYSTLTEFRERLEMHLKALIAQILEKPPTRVEKPVAPPERWKGSPFLGLRAFTAADAPIFFGREREVDALVARVQEHPFVAVIGASGSGKSSLVAAGVIPRLQLTIASAGHEPRPVLHLTPDRLGNGDPFTSLASAILHAFPDAHHKGLAAKFSVSPDVLPTILPPRTLLFIDQFEELFTTVRPAFREPFVDALQRVRTIITVRGDFYGHCVEMPALARLMESSTFPLAAPGVAALYEMITRPAARAALTFEDGLAQRILEDTGQEPGALALMAYTLDELYRHPLALTDAAYNELGGVHGAIGQRSETIFATLGDDEQAALPHVFRELVDVDERGTATRQRAPLSRIATTPAASRLTAVLTEARLLVQSRGETGEAVVEVAHEALFRSWSRLADWTRSAADDLRLLRQLRLAADEWDRNGRRDDFLWSHERLLPVNAACERLNVEVDGVVADFMRPEYERIVDAVRDGLSEARERAAVERLVEIGVPAVQSLVECLQYAWNEETRSDINHALTAMSDVAVPHLLNAVFRFEDEPRAYVVDVLSNANPVAGKDLLPRLLFDQHRGVRVAATVLTALARADQEIPTLCGMLRNDPSVKEEAFAALATFDSPVLVHELVWVLENNDSLLLLVLAMLDHMFFDRPFWIDWRLRQLITTNRILHSLSTLTRIASAFLRRSQGTEHTIESMIKRTLRGLLSAEIIHASISSQTSALEIEQLFAVLRLCHGPAIEDFLMSADIRLQRHALRSIRDIALENGPPSIDLGLSVLSLKVRESLYALLEHEDGELRQEARDALEAIALTRPNE